MKKILILMTSICLLFGLTGCSKEKTDPLKFKEEYEVLNDEDSGYGKYTIIEIPEDNAIVYSNVGEILSLLENGTGVIYFGFPECPWCRSAIAPLLNTADMVGIDKIYYFNAKEIRDQKKLDEEGKVVVEKEGSEEYYDLLKALGDSVSVYEGLNDDSIKRLYFPTVVFVKEGEIIGYHEGTVESQENPMILLNKEQEKELSDIYANYMHKMLGDVCDDAC